MDCISNWKLNNKCEPPHCKIVNNKKTGKYCRKTKNLKKSNTKNDTQEKNISKKSKKSKKSCIKVSKTRCSSHIGEMDPSCQLSDKNRCTFKKSNKKNDTQEKNISKKSQKSKIIRVQEKDLLNKGKGETDYLIPQEKKVKIISIYESDPFQFDVEIISFKKDMDKSSSSVKKDKIMSDLDKKRPKELPKDYEIIKLIGKGNFASVYKVKKGNKYFALRHVKGKAAIKRLLNIGKKHKYAHREMELQIVSSIVKLSPKIYDIFISENNDSASIIMQLIEGMTLIEVKEDKSMNQVDKNKIFKKAIESISKLHQIKWTLQESISSANKYNLPVEKI